MTTAWIFDALPGLVALLVAGGAYFGTRRVVMNARSATPQDQAAPEVEATSALTQEPVTEVVTAPEAIALADQQPTLFETGASIFDPVYRRLGAEYLAPDAGVIGTPFHGGTADFFRGRTNLFGGMYKDVFTDQTGGWWRHGVEADVHRATDISPEEGIERLLRAVEANRLVTTQLVEALRTYQPRGAGTPDKNEESMEQD